MRVSSLLLAVAACLLCVVSVAAHEITSLPGLAELPSYKMYSGYLKLPSGTSTFYWFAESQGNPQKDPVIAWTNGMWYVC
jgi:carboxypeptidase C (cathepsin A)